MFYEELYTELGKLFYHLAAVDGKVQPAEKEALQKLIKVRWMPLDDSEDEFGTDLSNLIDFSFDYEASEIESENGLDSFTSFYKENKKNFKPAIIKRILETVREIADAYKGENKQEKEFLKSLEILFKNNQ